MNTTNTINYFETVAVPILQRKCQELFNAHMALETSLHMEVAQTRNLMEELSKLKAAQSSSASDVLSLNDQLSAAITRADKAENDYRNLQITLNDTGNALSAAQNKITTLESELMNSRKALEVIQQELQATKSELQQTQREYASVAAAKTVSVSSNKTVKSKVIGPTDDF